jgi:hypothetical protein
MGSCPQEEIVGKGRGCHVLVIAAAAAVAAAAAAGSGALEQKCPHHADTLGRVDTLALLLLPHQAG